MLMAMPLSCSRLVKAALANWLPWSELNISGLPYSTMRAVRRVSASACFRRRPLRGRSRRFVVERDPRGKLMVGLEQRRERRLLQRLEELAAAFVQAAHDVVVHALEHERPRRHPSARRTRQKHRNRAAPMRGR
jgi:hypothetical protein